jgi:hypothetical protein
MKKAGLMAAVIGAIAALACAAPGKADERQTDRAGVRQGSMQPTHSRYHRKRGTRVRGFLERRGGYYSYNDSDVINVYGGSRTQFGSINSYRDPYADRQTTAGPFDHGFFFDSGIGPHGGDTPYPR